jgi:cell wall assembly regulator SMI1
VIEQATRRIAEEIIACAPAGWTEVLLTSTAHSNGLTMSGRYAVPGEPGWRRWVPSLLERPSLSEEWRRLAGALAQIRGWTATSLEIRCRASGEYALVATAADTIAVTFGMDGFQAVLDPGCRLPQPGYDQEGSTASPEGDPALAIARLGECLERRAAILGRPQRLPPPASAAALDEAERRLGHSLPADLRALYLIADGDLAEEGYLWVFGHGGWLALKDLVADHAWVREPPWFGWSLAWDSVVFDADPPQTVRRCGGHPAWLPFGTREDGNYLAVDLAPARNGRPGQVIRIGRDHDDGPVYEAGSVTSLLGRHLELLQRGAFEVDEGEILLEEPTRDLGPNGLLDEIPDELPPSVQTINIHEAASPVDLTPLAACPNLLELSLSSCFTADLTPLRTLPVESVCVTLDGGDLTPLEGHRSIASLDLGTTAAVDIAPLGTARNLLCLDLSRASVRDLTVLSGLPSLRYLALTARQWNTLLHEGQVPPGLAAVRLADDASLDEAHTWAARLGLDVGEVFRASGTIAT